MSLQCMSIERVYMVLHDFGPFPDLWWPLSSITIVPISHLGTFHKSVWWCLLLSQHVHCHEGILDYMWCVEWTNPLKILWTLQTQSNKHCQWSICLEIQGHTNVLVCIDYTEWCSNLPISFWRYNMKNNQLTLTLNIWDITAIDLSWPFALTWNFGMFGGICWFSLHVIIHCRCDWHCHSSLVNRQEKQANNLVFAIPIWLSCNFTKNPCHSPIGTIDFGIDHGIGLWCHLPVLWHIQAICFVWLLPVLCLAHTSVSHIQRSSHIETALALIIVTLACVI